MASHSILEGLLLVFIVFIHKLSIISPVLRGTVCQHLLITIVCLNFSCASSTSAPDSSMVIIRPSQSPISSCLVRRPFYLAATCASTCLNSTIAFVRSVDRLWRNDALNTWLVNSPSQLAHMVNNSYLDAWKALLLKMQDLRPRHAHLWAYQVPLGFHSQFFISTLAHLL